ncbi:MAG TPA: isochorismatase family protein [Xanthobacteraceae bacterium]|jgi:maleamate amidohydrolase|nr:isochorismatase family protein [Xanthobacteraceae bacterium]
MTGRDDLAIYRAQGFGNAVGMGARPALCIVDFTNGFVDPAIFGGGNIPAAVANTVGLLAAARRCALPVAFSRVVYADDGSDNCAFVRKVPALATLTEHASAGQIVSEFKPLSSETIIRKTQPSVFFGTDYAEQLRKMNVDTVIITGCTTSGCVRATVVDAMSYDFRTIVASDCVGDRSLQAHDANLFDIAQKYADLMESVAIISALRVPAATA